MSIKKYSCCRVKSHMYMLCQSMKHDITWTLLFSFIIRETVHPCFHMFFSLVHVALIFHKQHGWVIRAKSSKTYKPHDVTQRHKKCLLQKTYTPHHIQLSGHQLFELSIGCTFTYLLEYYQGANKFLLLCYEMSFTDRS